MDWSTLVVDHDGIERLEFMHVYANKRLDPRSLFDTQNDIKHMLCILDLFSFLFPGSQLRIPSSVCIYVSNDSHLCLTLFFFVFRSLFLLLWVWANFLSLSFDWSPNELYCYWMKYLTEDPKHAITCNWAFWNGKLTFSGKNGVTNGIWNVLLYECNVSNDSGETAPSIENTPRENWLQTVREKEEKKRKRERER